MPFVNALEPMHLIVILVIAVLILGPKRLPGMAKSMGQGIREFRNVLSNDEPEKKDSGKRAAVVGEKKE